MVGFQCSTNFLFRKLNQMTEPIPCHSCGQTPDTEVERDWEFRVTITCNNSACRHEPLCATYGKTEEKALERAKKLWKLMNQRP